MTPATSKTCLTCRFLDEPNAPHKWHPCLWWQEAKVPLALESLSWKSINREQPFVDCPVHEERGDA